MDVGKMRKKYRKEQEKKYKKRGRQLKPGAIAAKIVESFADGLRTADESWTEFCKIDFTIGPRVSWHPEASKRKYYLASQLTSSKVTEGLDNLERGGYIKRKGKRTVLLTKKGVREILKYKMKNKHRGKPWDGKWRIIVFDIKEITRKDRDYLRQQLKWIGFEELQKSVWVFPYEIRDELREFIKLCKFAFHGDVRFILADSIEPDIAFREKFNLHR